MLKNHIKLAWRNLKGSPLFSSINIIGLSLGLAISLLLFLFITYEYSYDSMYKNKGDIYRVLVNTDESYDNTTFTTAPAALAPAIQEDLPEVEIAGRMLKHGFGETAFVTVENDNYIEKELYWTDPEIIDIFDIEFLQGDPKETIVGPNKVILSKSTAQKYFGAINPIGKTLKVDSYYELEVTGVFKDFPKNSTMHCNMIGSFASTNFSKNPTWGNSSFETYIKVAQNIPTAHIESQLQQLLNKNVDKEGQWFSFGVQPIEKIHLYSAGYKNSYSDRLGDVKEIRNLSFLALLILMIACVNYMNLMTARSQKRAKDVGINKTMGATSKNLVFRFYAETALVTLIALGVGLTLAVLLIPAFNTITGQQLSATLLLNKSFLGGLLSFWILTTLIAGSYPAFYLSRSSPRNILNPVFNTVKSFFNIRKSLVVLQFAASAILIVAVLIIYKQLDFIQQKDLGFNSDNVVAISTTGVSTNDKANALVQEFKSLGNVTNAARAQGFPGITVSGRMYFKDESDENGNAIKTNRADAELLDVLKLDLLAGKNLPIHKQEGDTLTEVVLNKKAITYLGYKPQEAIGKNVLIGGFRGNARIVGVVDDFNFESLHQPVGAYAFHNRKTEPKSFVLVRFSSKSISEMMTRLEAVFTSVVTDSSFEYTFLDKNLELLYSQERKSATLGIIFCVLAVFVACLGLFGLAAYTAEQRKKEIGVRKVLGASVLGIVQLLSKDFLKLVLIALIVAFPIAYYVMNNWLSAFAYRINIEWTIFLFSSVLAIAVALFTVSFQAISAALANPVKSLKTE